MRGSGAEPSGTDAACEEIYRYIKLPLNCVFLVIWASVRKPSVSPGFLYLR